MDSKDAKACPICQEEFDELQRCPRSFPCAHCICTQCITDLIDSNKSRCPLCRKPFNEKCAQEFGVTTKVLDLVKLVKEIDSSPENPQLPRDQIVEAIQKKCTDVNIKYINVSQQQTDFIKEMIDNNEMLKRNILINREILMEDIMNLIKEMDVRMSTEVDYLDVQNHRLNDQLEELEAKNKELEDAKQSLDGVTSFKMFDDALDETGNFNKASQSWLENIKRKTSKEEKILEGMKKNLEFRRKFIGRIRNVLASQLEVKSDLKHQRENIIQLDNIAGELTCPMLQNPSPAVKYLANLEGIYTIQENEDIKRCSKISFSWDNKIFLHCFTQQELPEHVITIKHDDVMSLVDPSSRTTFLELGTTQSNFGFSFSFRATKSKLGRILIKLSPDTKRAQNFSLLCSGSKGPSYLNTELQCVSSKGIAGEYVSAGYSVFNNDTEGDLLVLGVGEEEGGVLEHPDLAGTVGGFSYDDDDKVGSNFFITTRDDPDTLCNIAFGKVESGLNVLKDAIEKYPDIFEVQIIDCGIVLSLS